MGMSADYEIAVLFGATSVRCGIGSVRRAVYEDASFL